MKRYRFAAIGLGVLLLPLLLLTRFGAHALRGDTVTVDLGFEASRSARAQALDEHLLTALERGYFGAELRRRLDRPARRVQLERFWADRCEVRQIDFEQFARWRRRSGRRWFRFRFRFQFMGGVRGSGLSVPVDDGGMTKAAGCG